MNVFSVVVESEHYIFHMHEESFAAQQIEKIVHEQESHFAEICHVLKVQMPFKINYWLCDSREEVGHCYGDEEPMSGFARMPNHVFCVYNEQLQCNGAHEDTHIIASQIQNPDNQFIKEGLAVYFSHKWWGIPNPIWAKYCLEQKYNFHLESLLDNDYYWQTDVMVYPIGAMFVQWMFEAFGVTCFLEFYRDEKPTIYLLEELTNMTVDQLNVAFEKYINQTQLTPQDYNRITEEIAKG